MLLLTGATVLAYLIGSLSGSMLLGRLRGVDIRQHGSGNAGGTNALRTQGWRFALGVVVIDIGKGLLAALIGLQLAAPAPSPFATADAQAALCGLAAAVGHCWPLFFGLRGGKGAGTVVGVVIVLAPILVLPLVGVWLLVIIATGYVGLATVIAALALPAIAVGFSSAPAVTAFAAAATLLIVFTHRGNLVRLARGSEYRFEKARVLHRLARRD